MFSRSGNTTEVLRKMPDVRIGDKSKMAAYNRKAIDMVIFITGYIQNNAIR